MASSSYKKYLIGAFLLLGVGALAANKIYRMRTKNKQLGITKPNTQAPVSVNAFVIHTAKIENGVMSTGTAIANETVSLQPEVNGRITQLNIREGGFVSKGTLLVKLFDADLQAQLRKLKLQEELAQKTELRLKELLRINAVSQQEYDNALNALHSVQADMDLVQANIQKTEIRAPFSGQLGFRNVSEGAFVAPGTIVTTIQQLQPMRIEFSVPEKYISMLTASGNIEFTMDGYDETFTAQVYAVDPHIDEGTRSVKIRANFANTKTQLMPGSFVKILLPLQAIENGIMIPTEAVIPEMKGQKVFISRNGKAFPQPIETGIRNDSTIQVISGLKEGDTLITTGIMQLKPESALKFVNIKQ